MKERAILITGASTGIGKSTALYLDQLGFRVYAGYRKAADGDALKKEGSERLIPVELDVLNEEQMDGVLERISKENDGQLYALINNASVAVPLLFEVEPLDAYRKTYEVNLFALVNLSSKSIPLLEKFSKNNKVKSRIVNVSSVGAFWPFPVLSAYHSVKLAVQAVCDSMRVELAPSDIHVSIVYPGSYETPIWNKGNDEILSLTDKLNDEQKNKYSKLLKNLISAIGSSKMEDPLDMAKAIASKTILPVKPKAKVIHGPGAGTFRFIGGLPISLKDAMIKKQLFK